MSSLPRDDRFAPPRSHVEDVEATEGMQLATRGSRLAAAIVDVVIAIFLIWLVGRLTPFNPWGNVNDSLWMPQFLTPALGLVIFFVAHGWLLATRAQTVGKVLLKIRIARPDGSKPSFGRLVVLRYGVGWVFAIVPMLAQIWGLVDALLIFRTSRRCLHDSIADTIVIKA
jgi:uncharacterized RDD family membrane protein YckC